MPDNHHSSDPLGVAVVTDDRSTIAVSERNTFPHEDGPRELVAGSITNSTYVLPVEDVMEDGSVRSYPSEPDPTDSTGSAPGDVDTEQTSEPSRDLEIGQPSVQNSPARRGENSQPPAPVPDPPTQASLVVDPVPRIIGGDIGGQSLVISLLSDPELGQPAPGTDPTSQQQETVERPPVLEITHGTGHEPWEGLSTSTSTSRHSFLWVLGFAVIFLAGLVVGTTINNNNTDRTVARFLRRMPAPTRADVTDSETLSPQKKAFVWVIMSYFSKTGDYSSSVDLGKRMNQRFALATLYYATMGDDWTNHTGWLEGNVHECDWHGITCNKDGLIQIIDLGKNGLNGTLPMELSLLAPSLEKLNLWGNALSGAIPSEYGDLSKLSYFDIGFNSLTGTIPITLRSLTNLEHFGLYNNDMGGSIPTEIFLLPNLQNLILGKNPLAGTIPTEIGLATSLHGFYLYDNKKMTGSIPTELGLLSDNLVMLGIAGLSLIGKIPSQLGALTKLESLDLNGNNLIGPIPTDIAQLVNLKTLELYNNQLSEKIPTQIGFMTNLESLSLSHNILTGPVPTELGMLSKLQQLDLSDNELSGNIPSELSNLVALLALWLRNNALYGALPTELGKLTQLANLDLSNNQFSGSIPTKFGNLVALGGLWLRDNALNGALPSELGKLSQLTSLDLPQNRFSGRVPTELGKLTSLENLWLQSNDLSGSLPTEVGELKELKKLDLSNNHFSGVVPTALVTIPNLQYLCLQTNTKLSVPKQPRQLNKLNLSECNYFERQAH